MLAQAADVAPYALTGSVFATDRAAIVRGRPGAAVLRRQLLRQRQADRRRGRAAAVRRGAGERHQRQGRLDPQPAALGVATDDQGDLRASRPTTATRTSGMSERDRRRAAVRRGGRPAVVRRATCGCPSCWAAEPSPAPSATAAPADGSYLRRPELPTGRAGSPTRRRTTSCCSSHPPGVRAVVQAAAARARRRPRPHAGRRGLPAADCGCSGRTRWSACSSSRSTCWRR